MQGVLELLFLGPTMLLLSELVKPSAATTSTILAADAATAIGGGAAGLGGGGGAQRQSPLRPQHKAFCELVQQ